MKMMFIAVAVFIAFQSQAHAQYYGQGTWIAAGILTTQNREMNYFKTEYVQLGNFESRSRCLDVVKSFAMTDEYIGIGGTDNKVPGLQWNYDATCVQLNPF